MQHKSGVTEIRVGGEPTTTSPLRRSKSQPASKRTLTPVFSMQHPVLNHFVILSCFAVLIAAPAYAASPPALPTLLIAPFDQFDTSADQRPFVIADEKQWIADATAQLSRQLGASGRVRIISDEAALARVTSDYAHPSSCACLNAAARDAGAEYVFSGSIHKVSGLIIYMGGELDDAQTGKPLMSEMLEVKADNGLMLNRAADAMARLIEQHLPN
jgi:TolB-like protein